MVRMVRSLADRTFQLCPGPDDARADELRRGVGAHEAGLEVGVEALQVRGAVGAPQDPHGCAWSIPMVAHGSSLSQRCTAP